MWIEMLSKLKGSFSNGSSVAKRMWIEIVAAVAALVAAVASSVAKRMWIEISSHQWYLLMPDVIRCETDVD